MKVITAANTNRSSKDRINGNSEPYINRIVTDMALITKNKRGTALRNLFSWLNRFALSLYLEDSGKKTATNPVTKKLATPILE